MPPENQGSKGGKDGARKSALICANSIGFSPPQMGCQESGLKKRKRRKKPKTIQNAASAPATARKFGGPPRSETFEDASSPPITATATIAYQAQIARNSTTSCEAANQTPHAANNKRTSRANPWPLSGNDPKK